nr:MAG TPA: hypothetical protein [Caudoviricetes sp.]
MLVRCSETLDYCGTATLRWSSLLFVIMLNTLLYVCIFKA